MADPAGQAALTPAGPDSGSAAQAAAAQPPAARALAALLREAAAGRFPPADGRVTILPAASPRDAGVIGFSAHAVIFADTDPA